MENKKNELLTFTNEEFGEVRTVTIDGEPWFVGKDVAKALGYSDLNKAIAMHVDEEDKLNDKTSLSLGQRGGWLINESGLYGLILSSKLDSAKRFKRWVTSEVLPTLRKTGTYSIPHYTTEEKMQIIAEAYGALQENVSHLDDRVDRLEKRLDVVGAYDNEWMLKRLQDTTKGRVCELTQDPVNKAVWSRYFYAGIYKTLKDNFKVASLKSIPSSGFDDAVGQIRSWTPRDIFLQNRLDKMNADMSKNLLSDKKAIAYLQYLATTNNGETNPFR